MDPCGMGMDLLRTCYTAYMRWENEDGILIPWPVRWWFCEPDAKPFPTWHIYGSNVWHNQRENLTGPGEFYQGKIDYYNGARSGPAECTGQKFCGPVERFQDGKWKPTLCMGNYNAARCCVGDIGCCEFRNVAETIYMHIKEVHNPYGPSPFRAGQVWTFAKNPGDPLHTYFGLFLYHAPHTDGFTQMSMPCSSQRYRIDLGPFAEPQFPTEAIPNPFYMVYEDFNPFASSFPDPGERLDFWFSEKLGPKRTQANLPPNYMFFPGFSFPIGVLPPNLI